MMGYGSMGLMWLWPLLIAVALVAVGLVMANLLRDSSGRDGSARRIVDERYARGEIDDEEYRRRRGQLP